MNLEILEIRELNSYTNNPMNHTENQIENLKEIIKEYGFKVPIIVDLNRVVVAGHCRLEAAMRLGLSKVPCVIANDLSEEQIKAFRIAENKAREGSEWDTEKLLKELEELSMMGHNLENLGFESEELKELMDIDYTVGNIKEQDPIEPQDEPFSQYGDFYHLGKHKLLCGDSTNVEDVKRLVEGQTMDLMITDPPYNVDYESEKGLKIINDNMSETEFYKFLLAFYQNAFEVLREGASFYIFHADSESIGFREALKEAKFKLSQCLIWVKNGFNLSRQDYNWRHEPCLYGWKLGKAHYFIKDYSQDTILEAGENLKNMSKKELIGYINKLHKNLEEYSTIIREDKPLRNDVHPTMKPLKLLGRLILNSSKQGEKILDLFGGSGSTLITCDQIGRQAYLMEFDPRYVDVIVKRYMELGKKDIKLVRNGKEYSYKEIKEQI